MPRHTLYAYVDGFDLDQVASEIEAALDAFVRSRTWTRPFWVVNQPHPPNPDDHVTDLPQWDLGLNHELPDPGTESPHWFDEVEEIATFLGGVSQSQIN